MPPFDQGWYEAHRASTGHLEDIQAILDRARRKSRSPFRFVMPARRAFLQGFIRRLELEVERRKREDSVPFRAAGDPVDDSGAADVELAPEAEVPVNPV
ncbi:MAG: hypothetical protein U0835_09215 [Isosphaeraceae bacterium]